MTRPATILLAMLGLGACASSGTPPSPVSAQSSAQPAARTRVVVTLVVDQLAAWIADERWPELPAGGGFARLRREGTWAKRMLYAHAATDTAPGHAALYTATTPIESGIFGNDVPDGAGAASILRDPRAHPITLAGEESTPGASLARLHVDTLADHVRADRPGAVVVSVSLKDRGALFAAGRSPRAALWFDPKGNRFVTSTAVARAFPAWAAPVVGPAALARVEAETWSPLEPAWVASHAGTPDDQPGEGDERGLGTVFPHALSSARDPGYALRTSPFGDELLFTLALAAIDGEKIVGRDALVALSLSSNDYIGHVFGPDSWEAWDELERLDRSLGRFLEALDSRFGVGGYAVLLAADHGVTTMPEATTVPGVRRWCGGRPDPWGRACGEVGRIRQEPLLAELREAAKRALGDGDWVAAVIDPYVYVSPAARALDPRRFALLDVAIGEALRRHPEIDQATPTRSLPTVCPPETDDSVPALVCRSFAVGAGDYYVVPSRGSFFDPGVVPGKGTSHGSPYVFDRAVPLLAFAPGRIPAGVVIEQPVGFESFARTAAALLGVSPPGHASLGVDLTAPR